MQSNTLFAQRIRTAPVRIAGTLALLIGATLAYDAAATEMSKSAFQGGCEAGGGSFVEHGDGSFQCNLRSGGTIACQDTHSQCTYTARIVSSTGSIGNQSVRN